MFRGLTFAVVLFSVTGLGVSAPGDVLQTILNPDPAAGDQFGTAVEATNKIVVVGAPGDTSETFIGRGAFYTFKAKDGDLIRQHENVANESFTSFGASLALSGSRLLVGEPQADNGAVLDAGFGWVYNPKRATLRDAFLNPTPAAQDNMGFDVAQRGGVSALGLPGDDFLSTNTGAVYLSERPTTFPTNIIFPPTGFQNQRFGSAVAFDRRTLVVGAPGSAEAVAFSGQVHLFNLRNSNLITTVQDSSGSPGDFFGASISAFKGVIAIGAPGADFTNADAGAAYLYNVSGDNLIGPIQNIGAPAGDQFGFSVAISKAFAVVGAPGHDVLATSNVGETYVVDLSGNIILTIPNPDPVPEARFGSAVAISGKNIVIGAPGSLISGSPESGVVYIIEGPSN